MIDPSQTTNYNPAVPHQPASPVLCVDLGGRRIGIAVSESGVLATPHSVLRNEGDIVEKVARIGLDLGAGTFVVGLPRQSHASRGEERYRRFADALRQKTCKTVLLWDESLSTVEAAERLRDAGRSRRESRESIDMHAAAVILQSWLDAEGRTS